MYIIIILKHHMKFKLLINLILKNLINLKHGY